jgi:hypothetical protein
MMSQTDQIREKSYLPFHPLLFAIYPVTFLYAYNADLFPVESVILPSLVLLAIMISVWLALTLICRNRYLGALIASVSWLFFFSYGHLKNLLLALSDYNTELVRNRYLMPLLFILFVVILVVLIRKRSSLGRWIRGFNAAAVVLMAATLLQFAYTEIVGRHGSIDSGLVVDVETPDEHKPHIFYIVLDAYAGADVLQETFNIDNAEFREELRSRGFYVAEHTRSNYCWTILSLASSLHFSYLDNLAGLNASSIKPIMRMVWDNEVLNNLQALGYLRLAYAAAVPTTERFSADACYSPGNRPGQLTDALLNLTPIPGLTSIAGPVLSSFQHAAHRELILYPLEDMSRWAESERPVFVFSHILSPHPPFVFDRSGNPVNSDRPFHLYDAEGFLEHGGTYDQYISGYREQVQFINDKVLQLVDKIIAGASRPAVIILQADHGARIHGEDDESRSRFLRKEFSILNAIRLPGVDTTTLHSALSPVNSFRLIFNQYLGADLELLADRSYFSTWDEIYDFEDVTELVAVEGKATVVSE